MSIAFRADTHEDGVNLKDAVLASAKSGCALTTILDELEKAGYGVDSVEKKKAKERA